MYDVVFVNKRSKIWWNLQHTNATTRAQNLLNVPFAARRSHGKPYYDSIWCYIRGARDLDLNVTTVAEHSDIVAI